MKPLQPHNTRSCTQGTRQNFRTSTDLCVIISVIWSSQRISKLWKVSVELFILRTPKCQIWRFSNKNSVGSLVEHELAVPLLCATWFIKVFYLNKCYLNGAMDKPKQSIISSNCASKWTQLLLQFLFEKNKRPKPTPSPLNTQTRRPTPGSKPSPPQEKKLTTHKITTTAEGICG